VDHVNHSPPHGSTLSNASLNDLIYLTQLSIANSLHNTSTNKK
jgi:hypothetical protein